jgi:hypothetical protein
MLVNREVDDRILARKGSITAYAGDEVLAREFFEIFNLTSSADWDMIPPGSDVKGRWLLVAARAHQLGCQDPGTGNNKERGGHGDC